MARRRAAPQSGVTPWIADLAVLMDRQFRVPGTTFRFGLDPLLGLVPVLGDTVAAAIGVAMLREGLRLGVRRRVMARMVGNLALDWAVGLVPGIDLILDSAFRAHMRNLRLLERAVAEGDIGHDPLRVRVQTRA